MPEKYKGMHQGALSFLAYDVMETHCGEWMDWDRIIGEVARIRDVPPAEVNDAVRRAIWRMVGHGTIERQTRTNNTGQTYLMFRVPTRDYWEREETG